MHGANAPLREIDLCRLADISTEIFMMISALGRANRSYCGGHAHADHEVSLVVSYVTEHEPKLKQTIQQVLMPYEMKRDSIDIKIAKYMSDRGMYAPVHPVTKNWF